RGGLRPRPARGIPVGLSGGQGGGYTQIFRVELFQCGVQPEVLGQHPDAAREVGVRLQQKSQFLGGSVGVVPDDRRGGPEGGAAATTSGQQVLSVWGERQGFHFSQVAGIQLNQFAPRLDIPEADRLVNAARRQGTTIR